MSEFKIDKLGWYESNTGEKIKIIHELKDKIFIGTSKSNYDSFTFDEDGEQTGYNEEEYKLIKYLGPEFPKEPRKWTWEQSLYDPIRGNPIIIIPEELMIADKYKIRVKITMEEIIE